MKIKLLLKFFFLTDRGAFRKSYFFQIIGLYLGTLIISLTFSIMEGMEDEIFNTCKTFSMKNKNQEKSLIEIVKQNCRKIIKDKTGKKPFTNINIARL